MDPYGIFNGSGGTGVTGPSSSSSSSQQQQQQQQLQPTASSSISPNNSNAALATSTGSNNNNNASSGLISSTSAQNVSGLMNQPQQASQPQQQSANATSILNMPLVGILKNSTTRTTTLTPPNQTFSPQGASAAVGTLPTSMSQQSIYSSGGASTVPTMKLRPQSVTNPANNSTVNTLSAAAAAANSQNSQQLSGDGSSILGSSPSNTYYMPLQTKFKVHVVHQGQKTPNFDLDVTYPIKTIVIQIMEFLNLSGDPADFVLKFGDTEEQLTDDALRRKTTDGCTIRLVLSSLRVSSQVEEITRKLGQLENSNELRKTTFRLQKALKEKDFMDQFVASGGVKKLEQVIRSQHGNILAYALIALQNLMEYEYGWENFSQEFIGTLVSIIATQPLVNVCRPATAIVIKLVLSDRSIPSSSIQNYGYDVVIQAISALPSFLPTLVQRLSATDFFLQINSMQLVNCLFRAAMLKLRWNFMKRLDELEIRKVIIKLMLTTASEELSKQLVEFQRLYIQEGNKSKREILAGSDVEIALREIWEASACEARDGHRWRLLGFMSEFPKRELSLVGRLGLNIMNWTAKRHKDFIQKFLLEQFSRPEARRCLYARAHIEVTEILSDYWELSTGYTTTTSVQPFLFAFEEVHFVTLRCFFRLWFEMEANNTNDDFIRVAALVRSQFRWSIQNIDTMLASGFDGNSSNGLGMGGNGGMGLLGSGKDDDDLVGASSSTGVGLVGTSNAVSGSATSLLLGKSTTSLTGSSVNNTIVQSSTTNLTSVVGGSGAGSGGGSGTNTMIAGSGGISGGSGSTNSTLTSSSINVLTTGDSGLTNRGRELFDRLMSRFEKDMLLTTYSVIRARQLKELEVEDDLMGKLGVRQLRERLYKESFEFIKNQRIGCLMNGAWFPVLKEKGRVKNLFRFYRLAPNKRFLYFGELTVQDGAVPKFVPALETLTERIDISLVTEIATGPSSPILLQQTKKSPENPQLCFSLVSADTETTSLADFVCENATQYSEWLDGLNMLFDRNIATKDTAEYIQQLTDMEVKLCLLDLTGEKIDFLNASPEVPELPVGDMRFFYSSADSYSSGDATNSNPVITNAKDQQQESFLPCIEAPPKLSIPPYLLRGIQSATTIPTASASGNAGHAPPVLGAHIDAWVIGDGLVAMKAGR